MTKQAVSKDEPTVFDADIVDNNAFKFSKYEAKLLNNTVADEDNLILKSSAITVESKYLTNSWQSPEMTLIKCKVELKLLDESSCFS